jgi:hypothetical protein
MPIAIPIPNSPAILQFSEEAPGTLAAEACHGGQRLLYVSSLAMPYQIVICRRFFLREVTHMNPINCSMLARRASELLWIGLLSILSISGLEPQQGTAALPTETDLAVGETLFRTGMLPSGKPMKAVAPGKEAVPGSAFACASCHRRSGLGSVEEGLLTLPINGALLFLPRYANFQNLTPEERKTILPQKYQAEPLRPSYSDSTLAVAIKTGIDPGGRVLNPVMPRYDLSTSDMSILISYLKRLSSEPSPGVTDTTLAFATVITSESDKADSDAMLNALALGVKGHNNLANNRGRMGSMLSMEVMKINHRGWTLDTWVLNGPPDTWNQQLENYYKKHPVFALIGGISSLPWEPIHRFCEANKIPCLLPITDLPVISSTDYYTLYFSKGYYQEGEAAAAYLEGTWDASHPKSILQILDRGPEAKALAAGFQNAWSELGHDRAKTMTLKEGVSTNELAAALTGEDTDSIRLLWTGPESFDALKALAEKPKKPSMVFMSSTRLATRIWDLPAPARPFTFITYPFREPGPKRVAPKMGGQPILVNKEFKKNDRRILSKTNTILSILNEQVLAMERNYYRDYLVDLFATMDEQNFTDYENLLYSPGQNYGSEHCHIMQLSVDPEPKLVRMDK